MLIFVGKWKTSQQDKKLTNSAHIWRRVQKSIRATLVEGERCHHCVNLPTLPSLFQVLQILPVLHDVVKMV